MRPLIALLHCFRRCRRGVVASEFALILPVGIALLAGTVEVGNALLVDRKISRAAHIAADLIAQEKTMSNAKTRDIIAAVQAIMDPFPSRNIKIKLTSVYNNNGKIVVDWGQAHNTQKNSGTFKLPTEMVNRGETVIVAEISYDYRPLFDDLIFPAFSIEDIAFLKPRRTVRIPYN